MKQSAPLYTFDPLSYALRAHQDSFTMDIFTGGLGVTLSKVKLKNKLNVIGPFCGLLAKKLLSSIPQ
jgi:hypothetical protein